MPDTARALRDLLAIDDNGLKAAWGRGLPVGHQVGPPKNLFPRIETEAKR
jgi:methionyl-tRNA synthetase